METNVINDLINNFAETNNLKPDDVRTLLTNIIKTSGGKQQDTKLDQRNELLKKSIESLAKSREFFTAKDLARKLDISLYVAQRAIMDSQKDKLIFEAGMILRHNKRGRKEKIWSLASEVNQTNNGNHISKEPPSSNTTA